MPIRQKTPVRSRKQSRKKYTSRKRRTPRKTHNSNKLVKRSQRKSLSKTQNNFRFNVIRSSPVRKHPNNSMDNGGAFGPKSGSNTFLYSRSSAASSPPNPVNTYKTIPVELPCSSIPIPPVNAIQVPVFTNESFSDPSPMDTSDVTPPLSDILASIPSQQVYTESPPIGVDSLKPDGRHGWVIILVENCDKCKLSEQLLKENIGVYRVQHGNPAHNPANYPIIYHDGKLLGNYEQLKEYLQQYSTFKSVIPDKDYNADMTSNSLPIYLNAAYAYLADKFPNACLIFGDKNNFHENMIEYNSQFNKLKVHKSVVGRFRACMSKDTKPTFILIPIITKNNMYDLLIYTVQTGEMGRFSASLSDTNFDNSIKTWVDTNLPEITRIYKPIQYFPKDVFDKLSESVELKYVANYNTWWGIWYAEIRLANPSIPSDKLLEFALEKLKNIDNLYKFINNYSGFVGSFIDKYYGIKIINIDKDIIKIFANQSSNYKFITDAFDSIGVNYIMYEVTDSSKRILQYADLLNFKELINIQKNGDIIVKYKDESFGKQQFEKFLPGIMHKWVIYYTDIFPAEIKKFIESMQIDCEVVQCNQGLIDTILCKYTNRHDIIDVWPKIFNNLGQYVGSALTDVSKSLNNVPMEISDQTKAFNVNEFKNVEGWALFTVNDCAECEAAKLLLQEKIGKYSVIYGDSKHDPANYPVIFKDNVLIGGYSDLKRYFAKNIIWATPRKEFNTKLPFLPTKMHINIAYNYLRENFPSSCPVVGGEFNTKPMLVITLFAMENARVQDRHAHDLLPTYFMKCMQRSNKPDFILFPISLIKANNGHANLLLYDTRNNEMERFDPQVGDVPFTRDIEARAIDGAIIDYFNINLPDVPISKYFSPNEYCPRLMFQTKQNLQYKSRVQTSQPVDYVNFDPVGFCATWTIWYAVMRLLNPNIPRDELVKFIVNELEKMSDITKFIDNYSSYIGDYVDQYYGINTVRDRDIVQIIARPESKLKYERAVDILEKYKINYSLNVITDDNAIRLENVNITLAKGENISIKHCSLSYGADLFDKLLPDMMNKWTIYAPNQILDENILKEIQELRHLNKLKLRKKARDFKPRDKQSSIEDDQWYKEELNRYQKMTADIKNARNMLTDKRLPFELIILNIPHPEIVAWKCEKSPVNLVDLILSKYMHSTNEIQKWPKIFNDKGEYIGNTLEDLRDELEELR